MKKEEWTRCIAAGWKRVRVVRGRHSGAHGWQDPTPAKPGRVYVIVPDKEFEMAKAIVVRGSYVQPA